MGMSGHLGHDGLLYVPSSAMNHTVRRVSRGRATPTCLYSCAARVYSWKPVSGVYCSSPIMRCVRAW